MAKFTSTIVFSALVAALITCGTQPLHAQSKVVLRESGGRFQLVRNGQTYRVKGAGGVSYFPELAGAGGNSIRTWSTKGLEKVLDDAHKEGLTVCVGLWLQHERHGFDYSDAAAVKKQHDETLADVQKFKDHPAVLLWGIGNEMEGEGTNPLIWKAVNDIARGVKQIDPNHPTMTVIAELGEGEAKPRAIHHHCPDIDVVGINSYKEITTVADRYLKSGASKPYIITEHGPTGPWEIDKTAWGSPIEPSSTEKAAAYANGYQSAVLNHPELCLGSYAFLWGSKQETTATWFGMLLSDGSRVAAIDVMTELWSGSPPKNRCPQIVSLSVDQAQGLKPGSTISANLVARDPGADELTIRWVLTSDSGTIGVGGDAQKEEAIVENAVHADGANGKNATVTVPQVKGTYRLFAYVYDDHGGAAVANVPIQVDSKGMAPTKLPFVVYADDSNQTIYAASGYMGNANAVRMTLDSTEDPHEGTTCLKAEYRSSDSWGGTLWQSPANDWDGRLPGGANLTGATQLEFWVRGANGGEKVNFVFGILDGNQPYNDTAQGELKDVVLTKEWKKMTIPLRGRDLSRIKTGFGWSLVGQGQPVTFYLDDIKYIGP